MDSGVFTFGIGTTKTKYANMDNWTTFGVANWSINLTDDEKGCGCGCKKPEDKSIIYKT